MLESTERIVKTLVGSAVLGLGCAFMFAALAAYGIVSIGLARILLFFGGIVIVLGIITCDYLFGKNWKHYCVVGSISAIIIFAGFWSLDRWAVSEKQSMDKAASTPAPVLPAKITYIPLPTFALTKTPKPVQVRSPAINVVNGNQNVTGNDIKNSQVCPGGVCAGGNITNNYVAQVPWGNLKERTSALVHDLRTFIQERKYWLQNAPRYAPPLTAEKFKDWEGQSDILYNSPSGRFNFPNKEKILQEEFAKHNLIDPGLDNLLSYYSEELKSRHDYAFRNFVDFIDMHTIEEIANRFENLAQRIPD